MRSTCLVEQVGSVRARLQRRPGNAARVSGLVGRLDGVGLEDLQAWAEATSSLIVVLEHHMGRRG